MTDASDFRGSGTDFITKEFDSIVTLFSFCSDLMTKEKPLLKGSDEEWIRNIFLKKYVRKNKTQFGVGYLFFEAEDAEIDDQTYKTVGYVDIKVFNTAYP